MSTFESNPPPLMQCGCLAMAVDDKGNPCCPIHAPDPRAYKIAEKPDLVGRKARCHYYGKKTRKSECNYKGDVKENGVWICRCEQPSDKPLPFFKYLGPGSPASEEYCKHCSYTIRAHWPRFEFTFIMIRDWYKHKKIESEFTRIEHYPNEEIFLDYMVEKAQDMIDRSKHKHWPTGKPSETVIYTICLADWKELPSGRNHEFEEHGPWEYDEFYCGCHSWN